MFSTQEATGLLPVDTRRSLAVTVSVRSRFHAFDLARQLHQRGALRQLITTYPRFKVREWGIPNAEITSVLRYEVLSRVVARSGLTPSLSDHAQIWLSFQYDRAAAKRIPEGTQLFVGWSGSCKHSMRRAKMLGAKTIVERGSTHIAFQDSILKQTYAQAGLTWPGIPQKIIDREVEEYAEADFVSVPTGFVRKTFVDRGIPPQKIVVVPYGCDLQMFRPVLKKDDTFRIIHCGQISIQKGVHVLVRAFAELRLPNAELWLIGGLTPELRRILEQYGNPAISVKGPFPQSALSEYYSQGSVFCMASFQEGMAMVVPQAMSCGLPVIATFNSGAGEVVEDGKTGFIIPAGDLEALKEKLTILYTMPNILRQMAANLRDANRADISWRAYGDRMMLAYRKIVGPN